MDILKAYGLNRVPDYKRMCAGILLLLFAMFSEPLAAQKKLRIGFVNYGFGTCITDSYEGGYSGSGYTGTASGFSLVRKTNRISTVLNAHFGMEFMLLTPTTRYLQVRKVWTFPQPKKDPATGTIGTSEERIVTVASNTRTAASYILEYPYEMIKGKWKLQFFYKETLLFEQIFELY